MSPTIRLATLDDAAAIREIYAPFVTHSAVSFEYVVPTVEQMRDRLETGLQALPWLVCETPGTLLGYAYASPHRAREAYHWCAESSVYVAERARRRGVGRALYASLFAVLRLQGYVNAYAGIALPNPASVAMHEACGFTPVGVYQAIGYKFGRWHDVGWWQIRLTDPTTPAAPRALREVRDDARFTATLEIGLRHLRPPGR